MKRALLCFTVLTLAEAAMAQGTIEFLNYDPPNGVNGRFYYLDPPARVLLGGADWYGQLYVGTSRDSLSPVGLGVPFGEDAFGNGSGIVDGGVVTVPGIGPGAEAIVQLRAWRIQDGSTWEAAFAGGLGGWTVAMPITVTLGGGGLPPAHLSGLSEFSYPLELIIPEPKTTWLVLLGLLLCWWVSGAAPRRAKAPRLMD